MCLSVSQSDSRTVGHSVRPLVRSSVSLSVRLSITQASWLPGGPLAQSVVICRQIACLNFAALEETERKIKKKKKQKNKNVANKLSSRLQRLRS